MFSFGCFAPVKTLAGNIVFEMTSNMSLNLTQPNSVTTE